MFVLFLFYLGGLTHSNSEKCKSHNKGTLSTITLADNLSIGLGLLQVKRNQFVYTNLWCNIVPAAENQYFQSWLELSVWLRAVLGSSVKLDPWRNTFLTSTQVTSLWPFEKKKKNSVFMRYVAYRQCGPL